MSIEFLEEMVISAYFPNNATYTGPRLCKQGRFTEVVVLMNEMVANGESRWVSRVVGRQSGGKTAWSKRKLRR